MPSLQIVKCLLLNPLHQTTLKEATKTVSLMTENCLYCEVWCLAPWHPFSWYWILFAAECSLGKTVDYRAGGLACESGSELRIQMEISSQVTQRPTRKGEHKSWPWVPRVTLSFWCLLPPPSTHTPSQAVLWLLVFSETHVLAFSSIL